MDSVASSSPHKYPRGTLVSESHPHLVKEAMRCRELNMNENVDITLLTFASTKKVWFQCDNGHPPYQVPLSRRTSMGTGCPYCAHKKPIPGINDLETLHPNLVREWDYNNNDTLPNAYLEQSNKMVSWICPEGHHYEQTIQHRTVDGCGCPYCSGHKKEAGISGFSVDNPELFAMWDYNKNTDVDPSSLSACCSDKFWFICPEGHEFFRSPANRREARFPCPVCSKQSSSFLEQLIVEFAHTILGDSYSILERDTKTIEMELDIYIPKLALAFEPGAWNWHQATDKQMLDIEKRKRCNEKGIRLITIYDACLHRSELANEIINEKDVVTISQKIGHRDFIDVCSILESVFSEYIDLAKIEYEWDEIADRARSSLPSRFDISHALSNYPSLLHYIAIKTL